MTLLLEAEYSCTENTLDVKTTTTKKPATYINSQKV